MLVVSPEFKCSNEMLTIVAMLSGEYLLRNNNSATVTNKLLSTKCIPPTQQYEATSQCREGRTDSTRGRSFDVAQRVQ